MKQKKKIEQSQHVTGKYSSPTFFETLMNVHCDLRLELGLPPLEYWQKTRETPSWVKNIYQKLGRTLFKSILKLRPKGVINWRNYGRIIGIMERHITFLTHDAWQLFDDPAFEKVSDEKWVKFNAGLGEVEARKYYLKTLGRPATDQTPLEELAVMAIERKITDLEKVKQTAFAHIAEQGAKNKNLFLKGMGEGFTIFLNEDGQFAGDDRRADIHMELIAWQHDIEKLQRSVLPKTNQHLITELKKVPEFKNRTPDWFKDVFKDIKLSIGPRGRPPQYSQA